MADVVFTKIVTPGVPGLLSLLRFDATISESPTFASAVTEHPIESGTSISDHVNHSNTTVALEVIVSNSPVPRGTSARTGTEIGRILGFSRPLVIKGQTSQHASTAQVVGGNVQPFAVPGFRRFATTPRATAGVWKTIPDQVGGSSIQYDNFVDRVTIVHNELIDIKQRAQICTIYGKNTTYENMILTSLSASTDATDSLKISLGFTAAEFVTVGKAVGVKLTPLETRAKTPASVGQPETTPSDPRPGRAPKGEGTLRALLADQARGN